MKQALNPRAVSAFYFAVFALLFDLIAQYVLFLFGSNAFVPFFPSLLLSLLLGLIFGSLWGNRLAKAPEQSHPFAWGILMAISMLPFYSLGLLIMYYFENPVMVQQLQTWQDYLIYYGVIFVFFTLVAGIWLIPLTGFAAQYFNQRFFPGWCSYSQKQRNQSHVIRKR